MTPLPVRVWRWLLLATVVAVPAGLMLALARTNTPPAPCPARIVDARDSPLRSELAADVTQWRDVSWHSALTSRIETTGIAVQLIDMEGQSVFCSAGWPTLPLWDQAVLPDPPPRLRGWTCNERVLTHGRQRRSTLRLLQGRVVRPRSVGLCTNPLGAGRTVVAGAGNQAFLTHHRPDELEAGRT